MTRYTGAVDIGDVLITREGPWWVSAAIRLGAWLRSRPSICNHVIVVHHVDAQGITWGIEGRPGGVGWRDLSGPLKWAATSANNAQPKSQAQRYQIADLMLKMLDTPYDWTGIASDGRDALHRAWAIDIAPEWRDGQVPGQVVCSSLADYAYELAGLANPGGNRVTRATTPGDWDLFVQREEWTL